MNKKYKVGIVGATGMVGQRFALLLENHPWFEVVCLAASARSAGKPYKEALGSRWCMDKPIPANMADLPVYDAQADIEKITSMVDIVFCAVDMKKDEIRAMEEQYAKHECPVVSNNSANRFTPDVPMVVPELNPQHIDIIPAQRKRLGTKRGFIAVKSNCSLQSYVPAIFPLHQKYGIKRVLVCTYQAITAQCIRVPVTNGHLGAVFMDFEGEKPSEEEIIEVWKNYAGRAQELKLPSAPKQFLHYFTEPDRPQIHSERELEHGMAVSIGRLRPDTQYDYKFVCLSHNTLRGAAGGAVLLAELLAAEGYMD